MRTVVRFYTGGRHGHPARAVLHRTSCHKVRIHFTTGPLLDGWWDDRFETEEEAHDAAEAHVRERRRVEERPDLDITKMPGCCK